MMNMLENWKIEHKVNKDGVSLVTMENNIDLSNITQAGVGLFMIILTSVVLTLEYTIPEADQGVRMMLLDCQSMVIINYYYS